MALKFTLKKKDYDKDERTVSTEEFINRMLSSNRDVEQMKELPKTEIPK